MDKKQFNYKENSTKLDYKQKRGKLSTLMTEEDKKKAGIYLVHG